MSTKLNITWHNTDIPGIEKLKMDTSDGFKVESLSAGTGSNQD